MNTFDNFYAESKELLDKAVIETATSELSGGPYTPSEFAGKILAANQKVTLDTLRIYHEWLSAQLEK